MSAMRDASEAGSANSDGEGAAGGEAVPVLLPLPLAGAYHYRPPPDQTVQPGDYVTVPLGPRQVPGVVWDAAAARPSASGRPLRLREIASVSDLPPMPAARRAWLDWMAKYTLSPLGAVLKLALPVPAAFEPEPPVLAYGRGSAPADTARLTPARRRVLAALEDMPPLFPNELAARAGVGSGVIRAMVPLGLLVAHWLTPGVASALPDPDHAPPTLNAEQAVAAAALREAVEKAAFDVLVLDGVTGSGKTEVYCEMLAAAVRTGGQALVLVPEIALTPQLLARFAARFGVAPRAWHSALKGQERRRLWRAVARGQVPLVIGARSALFLPFPQLRAIVVDEEHDTAYKQDDGVAYHGRDMAVARAQFEAAAIALVSATPSLETVANVDRGRYQLLTLPSRFGPAQMPSINIIDLRADPPPPAEVPGERQFLAPPLRAALAETLAAGEQSLVFLNRRGYAPLVICQSCGYRFECKRCDAWLTEHRRRRRLLCHHCGYEEPTPKACPSCGSVDSLTACGPGVERIAEEISTLLPAARLAIMTADSVRGAEAAGAMTAAIAAGEVDIVIGTQMIAKGHHFPGLTYVAVVDADLGLRGGDPRATERTYQLLRQVAGRAGRAAKPGRVALQTLRPDEPVLQAIASDDREAFIEAELSYRQHAGMPPYGRLAAIIVSMRDQAAGYALTRALAKAIPLSRDPYGEISVLGPVEAPLALLRGWYRWRFLVRATRRAPLQHFVHEWLKPVRIPNNARIGIDVDPHSFL